MSNNRELKIGSFTRHGEPGSPSRHYFEHLLPDGGTICLESCMNGYCVGRYDADKELVKEKVCTRMGEAMEAQVIVPGYSMAAGDALQKAVDIANSML